MTQITKEAIEAAWAAYQKFGWSTQEGMEKALEAALPFLPIAGEGKVKDLEWVPDVDGDDVTSSASVLEYAILGPDRHGLFEVVLDNRIIKTAPSKEEAKSFAQDHYQTKILSALAHAPKQEVELPWRTKDLMRGLILFRTSNNAHGYTNVSILSKRVDSLPQVAKDELANMMRNIADELSPSSPGKDGRQEVEAVAWTDQTELDAIREHGSGVMWRSEDRPISQGQPIALYTRPQPASTALVERGNLACPCTTFQQDEDCEVGYPSLLCTACDGKGITTVDKVVALAAEMMKVAEQVDELEDPFAAWETIDLLKSQNEQFRKLAAPSPQSTVDADAVINLVVAARISQQDAELERWKARAEYAEANLAEARKAAFIEAAEIADERAKYWRERVPVDTMAMTKEEMREIFKEKSLALENIALSLREKSKEERS